MRLLRLRALQPRISASPFKSKEIVACTLSTIHNLRFVIRLVDQIRESIYEGRFDDLRDHVLGPYYS